MRGLIGLILVLLTVTPSYAEKLTVATNQADLRSSPLESGLYVYLKVPRYYPLDTIKSEKDFLFVRDFLGREGWIHKKEVDGTKGVVVKVSAANIRNGPGINTEVLFVARQGVTFKVINEKHDWLRVMHESGRQGWVYKDIVWGVN